MKMTEKNRSVAETGSKQKTDGAARAVLSLAVTLGGVLFLPQMLPAEGRGLGFSNSFLSAAVFLLSLPAVRHTMERLAAEAGERRGTGSRSAKRSGHALTLLLAFGFVLACTVGSRLEAEGCLLLSDWRLWLSLPFLTLFWAALLERMYAFMEERMTARVPGEGGRRGLLGRWESLPVRKRRLLVFLFFLLIWGIVLLAVWPGFFVYDAQEEFNEVAQRRFTTHHPLLHVLLLGGMISAGNKVFGSYNAGIACYMLFQMTVLALCFAWTVDFLRKKGAPVWLRMAGTLYFACFPVIQMYVLCSAKDTLYSAAMLTVMVLLAQAAMEKEAFFEKKENLLFLGAGLCFLVLMRHNGLYILILLIPVLMVLAGKGARLKAMLTGLAALLLALGISAGLKTVLHAQDTENQEMLTVPIQQLARTWTLSPEVFTEDEKEMLFVFLPGEALERYTPKLSDNVKISFNNEAYEEDPAAFWRLWLSAGCRAPASYLNAWLLTSYGFWYPDAVLDGYEGNTVFTFTYGESSYFGYETELPGHRSSFLPWLDRLFERMSLELFQQRIPVCSMLFSPGFLFWVYAAGAVLLLRNGRLRQAAVLLPAGLNWLTVLLGPTSLVRYVLIFWFALPLLGLIVSGRELCYTNTKTVKTPEGSEESAGKKRFPGREGGSYKDTEKA
ncbi:MAG TPA: hypothetical protein H9700_07805 [Candidatus Eisenbergiella intestinipullorum]|nr:hypothetical protein [Candidatus Eisenbergiella intestinipullorum]